MRRSNVCLCAGNIDTSLPDNSFEFCLGICYICALEIRCIVRCRLTKKTNIMKLLYVHGYNGDPYGNSYNNLKNACGEKYELHTIDYDPTRPKEAVSMIRKYVSEHKIDVVIGASLGGFLTMNVFGSKLKEIDNAIYMNNVVM